VDKQIWGRYQTKAGVDNNRIARGFIGRGSSTSSSQSRGGVLAINSPLLLREGYEVCGDVIAFATVHGVAKRWLS
jgi:hypothetical protein